MHPADGRVVSNFIMQALKAEPITVHGTGSQTRSFCYVDDLVDGLVKLMESPEDFIGPVNLGNPDEFTVRQLAEKISRMTQSTAGIRSTPLPQDDPRQRRPDIGLAALKLSWRPTIDLNEGLRRTIAYFRELTSGSLDHSSLPAATDVQKNVRFLRARMSTSSSAPPPMHDITDFEIEGVPSVDMAAS
jgi:UDP-glucuronate decarboxylase